MALLQKFSPVDLAAMRRDGFDSNSKMQGFAAVLQLHRSVTAEVLRRPVVFAQLDFPELIAAGDDLLIKGLTACSPASLALCINLLPGSRKSKVLEELSAELQSRLIDGVALLDAMDLPKLEGQLELLRKEVGSKLDNRSQQSLGAAEDIAGLLRDTSPKTQAALNQALGRHTKLRDKITEKMITIEDVLAVENDTLAELIDELEPEQIAILMSGLVPAAQQRVGSVLPPKIVITVQSEMQRLGSRQSSMRRAQAQSTGLQAALIDKLKTLVDEGVVDLRRRRTESSGQAAPNPPRGGRKEAG
jgi:flagellar motor switch protein FliG